MGLLNTSFNQLPVLGSSVGGELYYLRENELQILKQLRAPRIVTRGGIEEQASIRKKAFRPVRELIVHAGVFRAERERSEQYLGICKMPGSCHLIDVGLR